ncbi:hypothetical protein P8452_78017 [Trifolium repens]|nr:hypothetical protein P8452_78017 [Trifolium repens]
MVFPLSFLLKIAPLIVLLLSHSLKSDHHNHRRFSFIFHHRRFCNLASLQFGFCNFTTERFSKPLNWSLSLASCKLFLIDLTAKSFSPILTKGLVLIVLQNFLHKLCDVFVGDIRHNESLLLDIQENHDLNLVNTKCHNTYKIGMIFRPFLVKETDYSIRGWKKGHS